MWGLIGSLSITTKLKALAIAGGILTATHSGAYLAGYLVGGAKADAKQSAAIYKEAFNRAQAMEKSNAAFKGLEPDHRCIVFMRSVGMPDSNCD
jgi:hypothetical protein